MRVEIKDLREVTGEKGNLLLKEEVILVNGLRKKAKPEISIGYKIHKIGRGTVQKVGIGLIPNTGTGKVTGQDRDLPSRILPKGTSEILQKPKLEPNS